MKRLVMMVLVLVAVGGTTEVNAQSFLKKLGKKVENAAKNAIERNAERKTEEAVDKVFNGEIGKGKKDKNNNGNNNADAVYDNGDATAQSGQQTSDEMAWNKTDFVAGDEVIFEDLLIGEQLGEFPSMWELIEGNAEIGQMNGENIISMEQWTKICPLMKDMKNYLSESFTVEFDFYVPNEDKGSRIFFHIVGEDDKDVVTLDWMLAPRGTERKGYTAVWVTTSGSKRENNAAVDMSKPGWHKFALSFNKRALKVYLDGFRVTNVPNVEQGSSIVIEKHYSNDEQRGYIKNVRIAKGAVPLYDRMMSDGKFITYGITFDVGKATIKPESMGEINRIVQLMNENPDLKFSVEGHTDSTGNPTSNQTLSEQRSQAIVAKLVELGIAQDRLTAVGKGQNSPIADNNTDEGRAKNRRVEFVKQ